MVQEWHLMKVTKQKERIVNHSKTQQIFKSQNEILKFKDKYQ